MDEQKTAVNTTHQHLHLLAEQQARNIVGRNLSNLTHHLRQEKDTNRLQQEMEDTDTLRRLGLYKAGVVLQILNGTYRNHSVPHPNTTHHRHNTTPHSPPPTPYFAHHDGSRVPEYKRINGGQPASGGT